MAKQTDYPGYDKLESIVAEKVFNLEKENTELKQELALANAKLEVYDRILNITNRETSIGFDSKE